MGGQACMFYGAAEFSQNSGSESHCIAERIEARASNRKLADQQHWRPLMKELKAMRAERRQKP